MKVLITGAAGRIGQEVLCEVLPHGHRARGVELQPRRRSDIEWMVADIRDPPHMEGACAGMDAVIHLAAIPSPGPRERREGWPDIVHRNILGTYNVKETNRWKRSEWPPSV